MASAPPESIVGRLAPSPTGRLHVGHARSFLLAWWHVRSRGGRIGLRIEDLDGERVRPGMVEACVEDLAWLGLDWDGEPVVQSADTTALETAIDRLVREGAAYPCVCSRRDVREALSAPHGEGDPVYPGTCRGRWESIEEAERETGVEAGLRFRVPEGILEIEDGFAGRVRADVARECGDFLVAKRGGGFAYQLAVVVDDARMGVTEILRGDDLLGSTGRQWQLQEALGLPHPRWFHVPLVVDDRGERIAKRTGGHTLAALRESGTDPRAIVGWAARSAGLDVPKRVRAADVLPAFDLSRLPRSPVPGFESACGTAQEE